MRRWHIRAGPTVLAACMAAGAPLLSAGCSTSRLLVETARTIQENSAGSISPTAELETSVDPAAGSDPIVLAAEQGEGSWYGAALHGRRTASGAIFDRFGMTAAHPSFPFESFVRVTNLGNGRQIMLRITDRGPFGAGRIIDVSERAAELLGFKTAGIAELRVELIGAAGGQAAANAGSMPH